MHSFLSHTQEPGDGVEDILCPATTTTISGNDAPSPLVAGAEKQSSVDTEECQSIPCEPPQQTPQLTTDHSLTLAVGNGTHRHPSSPVASTSNSVLSVDDPVNDLVALREEIGQLRETKSKLE